MVFGLDWLTPQLALLGLGAFIIMCVSFGLALQLWQESRVRIRVRDHIEPEPPAFLPPPANDSPAPRRVKPSKKPVGKEKLRKRAEEFRVKKSPRASKISQTSVKKNASMIVGEMLEMRGMKASELLRDAENNRDYKARYQRPPLKRQW